MLRRLLIALLAGGASVFGYAPFEWYPLALIGIGVLAWLLGGVARTREGFALGFAWGFGAFVGGVSWLYVALERYGGMPALLAALAIALFCAYLALYPALAGATFVALQRRMKSPRVADGTDAARAARAVAAGAVAAGAGAAGAGEAGVGEAGAGEAGAGEAGAGEAGAGAAGADAVGAGLPANIGPSSAAFAGKPAPAIPSPAPSPTVGYAILGAALFAALWLLSEWLRGVMFTGFPWLALGYSQTPPSPLAGFLPLIGVYGVGGLAAFVAALVAFLPSRRTTVTRHWAPVAVVGLVLAVGMGLAGRAWTVPAGAPLQVALVQTNFEQSLKWDPERFAEVLQVNLDLVREAFQASVGFAGESPAQESALAETSPAPNFPSELRARPLPGVLVPALVVLPETTFPTLLDRLPEGYLDWLARLGREAGGDLVMGVFRRDEAGHIYNAAISLGSAPVQHYAKQHLVPFGEYSPPFFGWFYQLAQIPMSDQTRGAPDQPPMRFGDQQVALNICYEDLFGAELIRALPAATLMLNISNLAWYGDSLAQPQHLQIARVRALETGRPMLRSTNTGMTALVQPDGRVSGVLPEFERGVLRVEAQGYKGLTPYAHWGDWPALGLALLILMAAFLRRVRGSGLARESSP